jgi:hypothetical protein
MSRLADIADAISLMAVLAFVVIGIGASIWALCWMLWGRR